MRRWLRSSVALSVVEGACGAAVVLGGLPAGRVGHDMVDLAVLGGQVAELLEALPVAELHRLARRTECRLARSTI